MPLQLEILDNLAIAEVNIVLDAVRYDPRELVSALKKLQGQGSGKIAIRNAGLLSSSDLKGIATNLGSRLTIED